MTLEERLQRLLTSYLKDLSMDLDQDHGLSDEDYKYLKSKTEDISYDVRDFINNRLDKLLGR